MQQHKAHTQQPQKHAAQPQQPQADGLNALVWVLFVPAVLFLAWAWYRRARTLLGFRTITVKRR